MSVVDEQGMFDRLLNKLKKQEFYSMSDMGALVFGLVKPHLRCNKGSLPIPSAQTYTDSA
jgi:hypothetical protein